MHAYSYLNVPCLYPPFWVWFPTCHSWWIVTCLANFAWFGGAGEGAGGYATAWLSELVLPIDLLFSGSNKNHHFRFPEAIQHPIISNHIQSYPIISNHIQSNIVSHGFSMAKISSFSWGHGGWLHPRPAGHLCPRGAWHGRHHHHCHDPQPICARTHHCGDGGAAPDFIAFCG